MATDGRINAPWYVSRAKGSKMFHGIHHPPESAAASEGSRMSGGITCAVRQDVVFEKRHGGFRRTERLTTATWNRYEKWGKSWRRKSPRKMATVGGFTRCIGGMSLPRATMPEKSPKKRGALGATAVKDHRKDVQSGTFTNQGPKSRNMGKQA